MKAIRPSVTIGALRHYLAFLISSQTLEIALSIAVELFLPEGRPTTIVVHRLSALR